MTGWSSYTAKLNFSEYTPTFCSMCWYSSPRSHRLSHSYFTGRARGQLGDKMGTGTILGYNSLSAENCGCYSSSKNSAFSFSSYSSTFSLEFLLIKMNDESSISSNFTASKIARFYPTNF